MDTQQEICVASHLSALSQISAFVSERAALAGMDEERVFAVQMAVDEACTNCMEHAYEGREDGEVHICCWTEGGDFVIRITDHGRPFDPASVPVPDVTAPLEERQIGGLGLFLMYKLMDGVEFQFDPAEGNQVTLRKRRAAEMA